MPDIELQFVSEDTLGSHLIGWFSAGHLSHVDAVEGEGLWRNGLLGARTDHNTGVQIRPLNYARFTRRVLATIPASDIQYGLWRKFLWDQIGKPYDKLAIFGFLVNRNWRDEDAWFCSELQARALEVAGIVENFYLACNKITPVALALAVSAIPGARLDEL